MAYCHLCGKDEVDGLCPVCDPSPQPKKKKSKTKTAKEKVAEATEETAEEATSE